MTRAQAKPPLRGALVIGAESWGGVVDQLQDVQRRAVAGWAPDPVAPTGEVVRAPVRMAIDYGDAAELASRVGRALQALGRADSPAMWKMLRAQGIFRGSGARPKVAFMYPGQGSQYVNMLAQLRALDPVVAETFEQADRAMQPQLGRSLTTAISVDDPDDADQLRRAERALRDTETAQPAMLTVELALTRLLASYGIPPDLLIGHSLGEYGALAAAGAMPFDDALRVVSMRGGAWDEMPEAEPSAMAAVFAPPEQIQRILDAVPGKVSVVNFNSSSQGVIAGAVAAVHQAMELCEAEGHKVVDLHVSKAFHTDLMAPAAVSLRRFLAGLQLQAPKVPIVANIDATFYPMDESAVPRMVDILGEHVAAPVQFVRCIRTLYDAGARVFVEVGPKKALSGFVEDVLADHDDVVALVANHPKVGEIISFNRTLCGLYAAGFDGR